MWREWGPNARGSTHVLLLCRRMAFVIQKRWRERIRMKKDKAEEASLIKLQVGMR